MTAEQQKMRHGIMLAIGAYTMWGMMPIYFKAIEKVPAPEILANRIIWSFVLLAMLLQAGQHWHYVRNAMLSKDKILYLLATALLIGTNWLVYIWAVNSGHMLEASLGYYISPLISVLLGMLFFGEYLRKLQWIAVVLAICGVLIQLVAFGSVPFVAITLAMSFGLYGLLRKKVNLGAQTGLFIETLIMLPAALVYLFWIADTPTANFINNSMQLNLLLICAGFVTTLPMLCFTAAATRLKLSTLGFFQYIGPSLMFLLAVAVYGEKFTMSKTVTFAFIWSALVIFSIDGLRGNSASTILIKKPHR